VQGVSQHCLDLLATALSASKSAFPEGHEAVSTCCKLFVHCCVSLGISCFSSGVYLFAVFVHSCAGLTDDALTVLKRAVANTTAAATPFPLRLMYRSMVFQLMADIFHNCNKHSAALRYLQKALRLEKKHRLGDQNITLLRIAASLSAIGKHIEAIDSIRKSLASAIQPIEAQSITKKTQHKKKQVSFEGHTDGVMSATVVDVHLIIAAFHNLSVEYVHREKYARALQAIERAVELAVEHMAEGHPWMKVLERTLREVMEVCCIVLYCIVQ